MSDRTETEPVIFPNAEEIEKRTKEAAYFRWLSRGRYAQPWNEVNDWLTAEKEFQESLLADPLFPKTKQAPLMDREKNRTIPNATDLDQGQRSEGPF